MFIKKKISKKSFIFNKILKIYFFISLILLTLFTIFFFNTGIWTNNKKDLLHRIYFNGINHYINIFEILYKGGKKNFYDYEIYKLNIPFENVLLLEENRSLLIENSTKDKLFKNQESEFKTTSAKIIFEDKNYDIDIRLKGYRTTHFRDKNKSSYKITLKGEERLNGMKEFSFIKPRMRNYIHEWLFHEFSFEGKLAKLNYNFIYLYINGSNQGLYVLEEGFNKELIERNQRRNGPIFSIYQEFEFNIFESKLEVLNKNFWNKAENIELVDYAKKKFEGFLEGKFTLNETFDVKKWAWYFAVMDLTYTHHGSYPGQVKLFYNPVNGLFEPLPYDGHRTQRNFSKYIKNFKNKTIFEMASSCKDQNKTDCFNNVTVDQKTLMAQGNVDNLWLFKFFYREDFSLNDLFYKEYVKSIDKITNKSFLDNFFSKRKKIIKKINSAIYSDYFLIDNVNYNKFGPGLYYFSLKDIYHRANFLKDKFKFKKSKILIIETSKKISVQNNELNNFKLKLKNFHCNKLNNTGFKNIILKIDKNLPIDQNLVIKKSEKNFSSTKCHLAEFSDGDDNIFLKDVIYSPDLIVNKNEDKLRRLLNYFKFTKDNEIELKNDTTIIDEDLFIPPNLIVKINAGEKIKLVNNSIIHSYSPWIVGSDKMPTEIGGEPNSFGGGIFISETNKKSIFNNTIFSYLTGMEKNQFITNNLESNFQINTKYNKLKINSYIYGKKNIEKNNYSYLDGRVLYGAINFYNTKVYIKDCKFSKIDSEDAVNFISSKYFLENTKFEEVKSDAIDVDFGKGEINNSIFLNIGNDGIDLSGTTAILRNNSFTNVSDKIISVGENSIVKISNLKGNNSYIGVASKDGSNVEIDLVEFNKVQFPFASYIKKKSYTPGNIKVKNIKNVTGYLSKSIKDENSEISIEGSRELTVNSNILPVIYKKKIELVNEKNKN